MCNTWLPGTGTLAPLRERELSPADGYHVYVRTGNVRTNNGCVAVVWVVCFLFGQ